MKTQPKRRSEATPTLFARRGLYERFQRILARLKWRRRGEKALLGLSGGRDSVVLLHLLKVSGHRVIAAHLNHQLRGRESMGDEQFVRKLCRDWKVPLVVGREKVTARSKKHGLSIEEAARIARYRFFARVARKSKLTRVLVAHHQQDQAETLLLKIFRGCSREGLHGMEMKRPLPPLEWNKNPGNGNSSALSIEHLSRRSPAKEDRAPGIQLLRPLLDTPSSEITTYARQNRLIFREDSSNRDLSIPRNWIRHRLLPLLRRRLNRNVIPTLARLGSAGSFTSSPTRPF